jgi:hypothetical protein
MLITIKQIIKIASLYSNYLGCYDDGLDGARDLDRGMSDDLYSMSKELCLSRCSINGNKYFGLQYGLV